MNEIVELKMMLAKAEVGENIYIQQGALSPVRITAGTNSYGGNSCHACYFDAAAGARQCAFKDCCMAHKRPDRTSVIFKFTSRRN